MGGRLSINELSTQPAKAGRNNALSDACGRVEIPEV